MSLTFDLCLISGNMRNVNDFGSYCPQYDRPEQGLDLLTEAIASAGLTPGRLRLLLYLCSSLLIITGALCTAS